MTIPLNRLARVRRALGRFPSDLLGLLVAVYLANVVLAVPASGASPLRVVAGFGFVLLAPGYALVSTLFPHRPNGELADAPRSGSYSPGTAERVALSFGASLVLVPMLSLGHGLLEIPFTVRTTVGSVSIVTAALTVVALVARQSLPPSERYEPPAVTARLRRLGNWVRGPSATDTALNLALVAVVLLAFGSVGYGLGAPRDSASYTDASLVTETDGGEYVASNYPVNFTRGESRPLTLRVHNAHETASEYVAVVELQRVRDTRDGELRVLERRTLDRLAMTVGANETRYRNHEVEPTTTGENLRLVYYVYRGTAPDAPDAETADAKLHLWIDVEAGGEQ